MRRNPVVLIPAVLVWVLSGAIACAEPDSIRSILLAGVEANFAGDYERAAATFAKIGEIDPAHPGQPFYQAVVLFWRNNVDASNPRFEHRIREYLEDSKTKSELRLSRNDRDIEALHYLGLAYTYLGRLEAHGGRLYHGGVLGEKGRDYLEQALALCETGCEAKGTAAPPPGCDACEDLYFPFGAYSYFAGRLPKLLQFLNFLWFVPRGSTAEGLDALERSARRSALHQLGSKALLASIYGFFETDRADRAIDLSGELVSRFPNNPYLDWQHANLLMANGSYGLAAEQANAIMAKVDSNTPNYDPILSQGAGLVLAEIDLRANRWNDAEKKLAALEQRPEFAANTLTPQISLLQGMLADLRGDRERAVRFYQKTRDYQGASKNRMAAKKAKHFMEEPFTNSPEPSS